MIKGSGPEHGTTAYGKGCRCEICKEAKITAQREWRERNRENIWKRPAVCLHCGEAFLAHEYNARKRDPKYCSRQCAKDRFGTPKRKSVTAHEHPLAGTRGRVLEYRRVLFDHIGPGGHPCHWCSTVVEWKVSQSGGVYGVDLIVDHLDENSRNNHLSNLVPSCLRCNLLRSAIVAWERDTSRHIGNLRA